MKKKKSSNSPVVSLISLGCAKNKVDSELILGCFAENGWLIAEDPSDADICLVNTCGFIQDAREETAAVLHELCTLQTAGQPRKVAALGCLVKRASDCPEMGHFLNGTDARISFDEYSRLPELCAELLGIQNSPAIPEDYQTFLLRPRLRFGSPHSAYLKISEGCSNSCSFCSIPAIRGRQISRPLNDLVAEARALIESGAVEISLIAQDTTAYGRDLAGKTDLSLLLKKLRDKINEDVWFRLMYACPHNLTGEMLRTLASDPRFCPYIDMPLQHISDRMLKAMGRPLDRAGTIEKLKEIRGYLPGAAVRTAFIAGHPGETEADFEELLAFIQEGRFTHAGVFAYSDEPGTRSASLDGAVPPAVREERCARLMDAQRAVSAARCSARIGETVEVMMDGFGDDHTIARSQHEAPEVDGVFFLPETDAAPGDRFDVRITGAGEYDLIAEPVESK